MPAIAPKLFTGICNKLYTGENGHRLQKPTIYLDRSLGDQKRKLKNWLVQIITHLGLPDTKIYLDEQARSPDIVLCCIAENGEKRYIGIETICLSADQNAKDPLGVMMDYGDAMPSGVFKTEWPNGKHLFVKGYYLSMLLDFRIDKAEREVHTLVFCDGNVLNDDLGFYLEEERVNKPKYRQGPYGEGMINRRASYSFPNLLCTGIPELAYKATLIHAESGLHESHENLFPKFVVNHAIITNISKKMKPEVERSHPERIDCCN